MPPKFGRVQRLCHPISFLNQNHVNPLQKSSEYSESVCQEIPLKETRSIRSRDSRVRNLLANVDPANFWHARDLCRLPCQAVFDGFCIRRRSRRSWTRHDQRRHSCPDPPGSGVPRNRSWKWFDHRLRRRWSTTWNFPDHSRRTASPAT